MSATIFIDNKYTRIYYEIIENARLRTLSDDVYTERHHIIPKSLGGDNTKNNLISLTAREHYICHLLLPKMIEGKGKYKMLCAIIRMANSNQNQLRKIKSKMYERVKIEKAAMHSKLYRGKNNPFYSMNHSKETKQKLREARARQVERQGDTMTAEARAKLSAAAKGRVLSKTHKEKIGIANKGKIRSKEFRQACSERMTGYVKSKETIEKLRSKAAKSQSRK